MEKKLYKKFTGIQRSIEKRMFPIENTIHYVINLKSHKYKFPEKKDYLKKDFIRRLWIIKEKTRPINDFKSVFYFFMQSYDKHYFIPDHDCGRPKYGKSINRIFNNTDQKT